MSGMQTISDRRELSAYARRETPEDEAPEYAYVGNVGTMWRWAIGAGLVILSLLGAACWLVLA